MIWRYCFFFSIVSLFFFVLLALFSGLILKRKSDVFTPFKLMFAGVFVSVFSCLLPVYNSVLSTQSSPLLKTVLFSLHNTFQIFTIDADRGIMDDVRCSDPRLAAAYTAFLSVAYVVAPVLTFGFVASFFKNVSAYVKYFIRYFNDVYVFSELNEKSLSLATDISSNNGKTLIVFTDVFEKNEEFSYELIQRAQKLGAVCFKKDILAINYNRHFSKAEIVFFTIGMDETENINQSLKLIAAYKERENTGLYIFSNGIEGEILLNRAEKGKIKVRRINENRSLINRVLYESNGDLFKNAVMMQDGVKKISAVIVGLGGYGTEMLKALSWYCQMDGYEVEINAFDIDKSAEDRLSGMAPELMSEKYNGVIIPEEASYTIKIHSGIDVETKSFADEIAKIWDATYVLVSLGSDAKNIKAAVELRMLFERMKIKPVIQAVVTGSNEKKALEGITNFRGQHYNIEFIGDTDTSYSQKVIMNSELEEYALAIHKKWGDAEEFWKYEYNYNSSIASAIHMKARIACNVPGASKKEEELTSDEAKIIEVLEHRRWNAYMRSEGYIYSGSPDKSSRNDLGKMHHDLVDYSSLSDDEKRKDRRVGTV